MQQFIQVLCVLLFLYMCVPLITLEALANFSHSWQEGKDLRDINFLKVLRTAGTDSKCHNLPQNISLHKATWAGAQVITLSMQ